MTHSRWQKLIWGRSGASRRKSVRLSLEHLEDRLTPVTFNAVDASSLIADINSANFNGTANTINLTAPNGFYLLNGPDNLSDGSTGLPAIASSFLLTINGNQATIEGNRLSAFRLFDVNVGAALSLNNMTLEACFVNGVGAAAEGGAIFNHGTLTLSHDMIDLNRAEGTSAADG